MGNNTRPGPARTKDAGSIGDALAKDTRPGHTATVGGSPSSTAGSDAGSTTAVSHHARPAIANSGDAGSAIGRDVDPIRTIGAIGGDGGCPTHSAGEGSWALIPIGFGRTSPGLKKRACSHYGRSSPQRPAQHISSALPLVACLM